MTTKTCKTCGEAKPVAKMTNGILCKLCRSITRRIDRQALRICPECKTGKPRVKFSMSNTTHRLDSRGGWCKDCLVAAPDRLCNKCGQTKQATDFYSDTSRRCGRAANCKACMANRQSIYGKTEAGRQLSRRSILRQKYGISVDDYDRMLVSQGGHCAICPNASSGPRRLHVDHCHITGQIRGLLCGECNSGLAKFVDWIPLMEKAIAYLRQHDRRDENGQWLYGSGQVATEAAA